ncbi:MAG TPA: alpha/beta fold hydrolase [Acidimicrobiales bacterium]|nr:alpha/beta fold hydrolase [Acidimicrobiales bacterium]
MPSPTLILVHGAWGGAWCWRDFRAVLDRHGIMSLAVDLPSSRFDADPSTGLDEDAAAVVHLSRTVAGPIVLVGHSYGGVVVAEAAPSINELERLAYVAALVPLPGQNATATSREVRVKTLLDEAMEVDGEYLRLNPEIAARALYGECDAVTTKWATEQLSIQTIASFRSPRTSVDPDVPSRYIMCTHDHAIDPELQVVMASRCDETRSIPSDHSPSLSHPDVLFDALMG